MIKKKAKNNAKRISYVDTAKCVAIISVLLGHILIYFRGLGNPHPQLLAFLYTFHMPAFFIISGALFNGKKWFSVSPWKFITSRFMTLMVPYFFLDITGGIIKNIIAGRAIGFDGFLSILRTTFSVNPNVVPDWFLPTMFVSSILFYFFIKWYRSWFKYVAFIPIALIGLKILPTNGELFLFVSRAIVGFTLMYVGFKLKDYLLNDLNERYDALIVALVLLIVLMKLNGQIDLWSSSIGNPVYMILGGIVGTYFLFGVSRHIDNRFFQFIGRNTITFLTTHIIILRPLHSLLRLDNSNTSIIVLFIVVMLLEIPIMYVFEKCFPALIGKKKIIKCDTAAKGKKK